VEAEEPYHLLLLTVTYIVLALSDSTVQWGNKRLSRGRQQAVLLYTLNWPWRAKMLMIIIIDGPEGGGAGEAVVVPSVACYLTDSL
jgi:hypothetical protein